MASESSVRSLLATVILFGSLGTSGVVSALSSSPAIQTKDNAAPVNAAQPVNPINPPEQTVQEKSKSEDGPGTTIPSRVPQQPAEEEQDTQDRNVDSKGRTWGVRLSSDGLLAGRLNLIDPVSGVRIPAQELTIRFVQNGKVVSQTNPGVAGVFQAQGLKDGVYSLIASGPQGYLVTGLRVLPPFDSKDGAQREAFQIDVDVVDPVNAPLVRTMIRERRFPGITDFNPDDRKQHPNTVSRPLRTPVLSLDPHGHLHLRLHRIDRTSGERVYASGVEAVLLRDGIIVGKSKINDRGIFTFPDLDSGNYALLVTPSPDPEQSTKRDRSGYVAMGVIVREHAAPTPRVVDRRPVAPIRLVSHVLLQGESDINNADIPDLDEVPMEDLDAADFEAIGESAVESGTAGAATGGGGGGGGGGAGGLLGAALLGGAAGAIAGAAANQNGSGGVASPGTSN